jgi:hypothetical protein
MVVLNMPQKIMLQKEVLAAVAKMILIIILFAVGFEIRKRKSILFVGLGVQQQFVVLADRDEGDVLRANGRIRLVLFCLAEGKRVALEGMLPGRVADLLFEAFGFEVGDLL